VARRCRRGYSLPSRAASGVVVALTAGALSGRCRSAQDQQQHPQQLLLLQNGAANASAQQQPGSQQLQEQRYMMQARRDRAPALARWASVAVGALGAAGVLSPGVEA
jgi:hypothetical protein